ncbi:hypothetical protein [Helicobacter sp. 13S00477-4]|uniref:hypothetical protein n=1 Tax=Helicobacter sp. 13S00477-4 TaxID=1905759 RepID=UPI0015D9B197|nr:hypothetical protein [Helicobacter sp. 13S00477-4]
MTKEQNPPDQIRPKQAEKIPQNSKEMNTEIPNPFPEKRETYGFLVLELMSDDEYEAFQRATAGMNEGDKMLAAQSLYSLTSFYNGKFTQDDKLKDENPYEKNAQKAFGIDAQNNFLQKYKNAYNAIQKVDITL